MSAPEALTVAHAARIKIRIDGDDLALEASAPPPGEALNLLARHKAAIATQIRPGNDEWSSEDWREFFDKRAGIAKLNGALPLDQAEALAFSWCVNEWLHRNPVRSPVGRCALCGQSRGMLLSYLTGYSVKHPRTYMAASGMFACVASGT